MANPVKGEVRFTFDGKEYRMVFDNTTLAHFEDETDVSILKMFRQLQEAESGGDPPKYSLIGSLLAAGLNRHHPEIGRIEAMEMLAAPEVQAVLGEGIRLGMPRQQDKAEAGGKPTADPLPQRAAAKKAAATKKRKN